MKIKIHRPDESAAAAIFGSYLKQHLPIDPLEIDDLGGGDADKAVRVMIERTVEEMYKAEEHNQFLEVTYQNGDKEVMYFKDFASGAMIENIVRRSKKTAIKRSIATGSYGIRLDDLLGSIRQEYKEHEDLPNTTNPDDWAKISGKKGERIVFIRTLLSADDEFEIQAIIERIKEGSIEEQKIHYGSLDVLAHHLVGLSMQVGNVPIEAALKLTKRAYPFRDITLEEFFDVLEILALRKLVILNEEPFLGCYFEISVIGGYGAFMMVAEDYRDYAAMILQKLLREIGLPVS